MIIISSRFALPSFQALLITPLINVLNSLVLFSACEQRCTLLPAELKRRLEKGQ